MGFAALPHHGEGAWPDAPLPINCFNASRAAEYVTLYKTPLPGTALRGNKKRTVPAWTWGRDVPAAIARLRDACTEAQGWGQCDPDRLCIGWADLYYVPRSMYASFGWLSRQFGRHSANAELAVPTMMRLLSDWAHTSLRRLPCWGFCCSSTPCRSYCYGMLVAIECASKCPGCERHSSNIGARDDHDGTKPHRGPRALHAMILALGANVTAARVDARPTLGI